MGSMASITLLGNVGGDPEIRKTANGEVCTFSLAINRKRGQEEFTDWYRCVTFYDKLIDVVDKFVHKGSSVAIIGEPGHQKWEDRDGNEKVTFEVLITKLTLADPPPGGNGGGGRDTRGGGRDDRGGGRDDRGGSGRDDRAGGGRGARDDRGGSRDDRGGARDDRGGRGETRAGGRDDRGGGRDDRGGGRGDSPRGDRGLPRDDQRGRGDVNRNNDLDDDEIPF